MDAHTATEVASSLLRLIVYVFLRWVPGHVFPVAIYTLFALYAGSFFYSKGLPSTPQRSLLLGSRNSKNPIVSAATFSINVLLVLMSVDLTYRGWYLHSVEDLSFVRVGYVSDSEVKLLIREPDQSKMPVTVQIHLHDPASESADVWETSPEIVETTDETDYTATVLLPLKSTTQATYKWRSSNGYNGTFVSAPAAGQLPADGKFTFLSTSCIVNHFPYSPMSHALSVPGMKHLASVLPTLSAQFMLFLGDFIYIDVPHRFGATVEDYRRKYRQVYASPDWPSVGQNLPWLHVIDDHEIANDWDANTTGVYKAATDPYQHYHVSVNPPVAREAGTKNMRDGATYFEFTQGPATFFMLDTRTYRSPNNVADDEKKTFLGETQLADFLAWLARPEPQGVRWKVVASSVPFAKNWPINRQDTWGGFMTERSKVLEAMWKASTRGYGVVVLSGDRHEFAATAFPPPVNSTYNSENTVYEFSASPLNQFASPMPTYKQIDDEDVIMKYISAGNSKFGTITIFNDEETGRSALLYRLYIDGKETWNTTVLAPEVEEKIEVQSEEAADENPGGIWGRLAGYFG